MLSRTVALTRASDSSGTPEIALSSEYEVERQDWFGERWIEVLDHSKDAIDLSRAKRGLALLLDHVTGQVIGRAEKFKLGEDKVLRAAVRFSNSTRGKEAAQDFADDILTDVSVGYRIAELELAGKRDGVSIYRAIRWEPMEVSLVAVPADPTVGKDRGANEGTRPVVIRKSLITDPPDGGKERTMPEGTQEAPAAGGAKVNVEAKRSEKDLAKLAKRFKMEDALGSWIERDFTPEQALEEVNTRLGETAAAQAKIPAVVTDLGMPQKDRAKYSMMRAMQAVANGDWKDAGFEREVSEAISKEFRTPPSDENAFFMPTGWGTRASGQLDTATSTQGQELVFIEPGSFIELLRNKTKVLLLGGRFLPGLVGNVSFPRQTGPGTFTWTGEAPTADVAASNMTFDQLAMTPKTGQSMTLVSKRLLLQSPSANVALESLVRSDIAAIHGLAIDSVSIGAGGTNTPNGILATANSVSVLALGTNGAAPAYVDTVNLFRDLAIANSIVESSAVLTTPGIAATLMKTQKFATTNGEAVWIGTFDDGRLLGQNGGYRAAASNQVPSNLTKGTSTTICHAIIAGNFAELMIGEWGAMEILVDPYTLAARNLVRIISTQMLDIGLRHKDSFKVIKDALAT
ncbi:MAG TPA: phage major capsid protein [Gemmatimonadales bacterium]|jgi:HK97 family phage major capsid protein|nr:phage major capsid protein [Gemmatimonadales bacterium]